MQTKIEIVTPETAAKFLQKNNGNRNYRKHWVNQLASIIKKGEWQVTHQGIAFDKEGNLLDGQHRLLAVISAGMPIMINVTKGADPEIFKCIDVGVKRSIADATRLHVRTAEVCSFLGRVIGTRTGSGITPQEAIEISQNRVGELSDELINMCGMAVKIFSSAPIRAAAIILVMDSHDKDYVFNTYYDMVHMDLAKLPPICLSMVKQTHENNKMGRNAYDLFARGLKFLDYSKRNNSKLLVSESELNNVSAYIKFVYANNLNIGAK
jgi:hypothetical protein